MAGAAIYEPAVFTWRDHSTYTQLKLNMQKLKHLFTWRDHSAHTQLKLNMKDMAWSFCTHSTQNKRENLRESSFNPLAFIQVSRPSIHR